MLPLTCLRPDAITTHPTSRLDIPADSCLQDFQEEQNQVCRLVLQLRAPTPDDQFAVLRAARERLTEGGPARLRHTLPPLGFAALQLVRELQAAQTAGETPVTTLKEVCEGLCRGLRITKPPGWG